MEYTEHEKLSEIKEQSQWLGSFLDWLGQKGMFIGQYVQVNEEHHQPCRVSKGINTLLSEYFEIDLVKLELEKRDMLNKARDANGQKE